MLMGIRKKIQFTIINIVLCISVLIIAFLNFYKNTISINASIGSDPSTLIDTLKNKDVSFSKKYKAIIIFNQKPLVSHLESIDKLYNLFNNYLDLHVIFLNKYKISSIIYFHFHVLILRAINLIFLAELKNLKNYLY